MPNLSIITTTSAGGLYDDTPINLPSSNAVTVFLAIDGLTMEIAVARTVWFDSDPLEYTITITNTSSLPFVAPITLSTSAFDTSLVDLDIASVLVEGNTATGVAFTDGVLSMTLQQNIEGLDPEDPESEGGKTTITFQITKNP